MMITYEHLNQTSEPIITVSGTQLTTAQAMTVRVALEMFAMDLSLPSMDHQEDAHGKEVNDAYMQRIREIRLLMFPNKLRSPSLV